MLVRLIALLTFVAMCETGTARLAPRLPDWRPAIAALPTPAAAGSSLPQLSSSNEGVILSWVERDGERAMLKFASRTRESWSAPRLVASGDDWFVNWADVPSVVRLATGTLVANWLRKSGQDTYAYDVQLSYSMDEGKTWSAPFSPHHDGTKTEHGFASLFEMPGGGLGMVWLDGRAMTSASHGGGSHEPASGGAMSLRFAAFDGVWKQTTDIALDTRVCECCPTAAAVTAKGPVVAFRDRGGDELRDIHVSRLEGNAWTGSRPVHEDGWRIAACPVNGPMLSARGNDLVVAWFTAPGDQGHAFAAFSSDAGTTFDPPQRLDDDASLGRVDVELLPDGSAVASWIEFADGRAQFRMRRIGRSGARSPAVTVAGLEGNRASGYPRLARFGEELVLAWTQNVGGQLRVNTAIAPVPR